MLVVKLDAAGFVQWAKTYGGALDEHPATVAETLDGYFVIGHERSFVGGRVLLSLDANGGLRWAHSFGHDQYTGYSAGGVAFDGGAFIMSESHALPAGQTSHWFHLLKTDATGRTRGCCGQQNVPLLETSLTLQAQPQAGVVETLLTPTLANAGAVASSYSLSAITICESSAERLCNGILTGECLCESAFTRPARTARLPPPVAEPGGRAAEDGEVGRGLRPRRAGTRGPEDCHR
jgi:hypothetical protein